MDTADIKLRKADVAQLIEASFPGYKGRSYYAQPATRVTFGHLNWSGGSRSQYVALDLERGRRANLIGLGQNPPWAQPMEGLTVELPPGIVMVEHVVFCGKDLGLRFYFNPSDRERFLSGAPKALPAAPGMLPAPRARGEA